MNKNNLGNMVDVTEWCHSGNVIMKMPVKGKITSIRGMKSHTNVHKYEITTEDGRHYRDTLNLKP